jgi:hypothetical protein
LERISYSSFILVSHPRCLQALLILSHTLIEHQYCTNTVVLASSPKPVINFQSITLARSYLPAIMVYASSSTARNHDAAILKIIEMNLKEEIDLGVFQNTNNTHDVSDFTVSPIEGKRRAICTVSPSRQAAPRHVPPRRSMAGRRAVSFTALIPPGKQEFPNSHLSPRRSMAGLRAASSTAVVSPVAPNSHTSPRRSMAGRRAASSTALGAGSKGRHLMFPRQFSIPEEIEDKKTRRLHDYTESPIDLSKSQLHKYD